MTILSILATISGIFLGFGALPQAIKIFRNKSAKDISATTYFITSIGAFIWILYGFEIKNTPIIIPNIIGAIISVIILIGWFLYGRNKR
jgi:MtN3 and saliva related transmembrane protein